MNKKIVGFFLVSLVWAPLWARGDIRCGTVLEPHYDVVICLDPMGCDFERVFLDPDSLNNVEKIWALGYPGTKISADLFRVVRRLAALGFTVTGTDPDQFIIRTRLRRRSAAALMADKVMGPMIFEMHGNLKRAPEGLTELTPFRFSLTREGATYTFPGTAPKIDFNYQ